MSGILDSKTRVLDTVVTQEGKSQISRGGLKPVFATAVDRHSFYEADAVSGSSDATKRVYFEPAISILNDSITMEKDDSGKLIGYPIRGREFYRVDGLVEGVHSVSGTLTLANNDNFDGFASLANGIITQSLDRFTNLMSIGTRDYDESLSLRTKLSKYSHTFSITNTSPFECGAVNAITNVENIEPLFFDERLTNIDNFEFLPPVTKRLTSQEARDLYDLGTVPPDKEFGSYVKITRPERYSFLKLMRHLNRAPYAEVETGAEQQSIADPDAVYSTNNENEYFLQKSEGPKGDSGDDFVHVEHILRSGMGRSAGFNRDGSSVDISPDEIPIERAVVQFTATSSTNNLFMQLYELDGDSSKLIKLDTLDFAIIDTPDEIYHPQKHVFFAGKVFINSLGLPAYANLFTIIMD